MTRGPDPGLDGLDRHVPPGARRVHQAQQPRVRARGRGHRRQQPVAACSRHILPNVSHVVLVQHGRCYVVGFIKAEVILSYLGLGVPVDAGVSWGTMLAEAQAELDPGLLVAAGRRDAVHGGVRHRLLAA